MGKMKKLAEELAELRHCGEVLISISETLAQMFSDTEASKDDDAVSLDEYTPIVGAEDADGGKDTPETKPEEKRLTLEEVRAVMAEKSRAGHTAECRKLIKQHGASNLSGLDPKEYPALLAEVEAL